MDGARPLSPIWRFGGALDFFRDFADVERMTLPEIVLEERNFGPRARSIFFVNAVRAPHPLGEESGFGGWAKEPRCHC